MLRPLPLSLAFILLLAPALRAEPVERSDFRPYEPSFTLSRHTSLARSVAFSPDGARLVTGGADRALRLWNPGTGNPLATQVLPRSG
ncbi:MAG: hypothetical protein QNJ90_00715 [Planctomycetota bacterium]|nr:hypothetical protein [Planctomycetota bacterium]